MGVKHVGCILYIPHGSDNTWVFSDPKTAHDSLYIPHGSDNTGTIYISLLYPTLFFISHMVQIIRFWKLNYIWLWMLYIPHGSDNTFKLFKFFFYFFFILYIPHGSDNTCFTNSFNVFISSFISHMVQIILSSDGYNCVNYAPLYPTWFR